MDLYFGLSMHLQLLHKVKCVSCILYSTLRAASEGLIANMIGNGDNDC